MQLRTLRERSFRRHPDLEVVATEGAAVSGALALAAAPDPVCVLRSKARQQDVLAVDYETAMVFDGCGVAGRLDEHVRALAGADCDVKLARLVCDGVLQIETADGRFAHGWRALRELFDAHDEPREDHPIAVLSSKALRYGALLHLLGHGDVSWRLYGYNTASRTEKWTARLYDDAAVYQWAGLSSERLHAHYHRQPALRETDAWVRWRLRGAARSGSRFKVYVSPVIQQLPDVLAHVITVCCDVGIPDFKVGRDLANVLRPDKIVLYVNDRDTMMRVADEPAVALRGYDAQGVPFTAAVDARAIVTWGLDPLPGRRVQLPEGGSWRQLVAHQLAAALRSSGATDSDTLVAFALARVRLECVDTKTWQPTEEF